MGESIQTEVQWQESVEGSGSQEIWSEELPHLVQRWMQARGFSHYSEFSEFVEFSLKDLAHPSTILDMDKAVARLIQAFADKEKICLYGDYDMDGTPGLALLIRGLQYLGFANLLSFQPNRFEHGYGVHADIIEDFILGHQVSLFVTVDVGITAVEAVAKANEHGVDFIITDHHQQKEQLPAAHAIVNPNREECSSDLKHLCGTGVAFYLVLALRSQMQKQNLLEKNFDPKKLLDCFAIATVTDMVPLVRENRPLVQHGLLQLARTDRMGLKHLMQQLNLAGKGLTSADVAIGLSPKLNALGRMNSEVQALDLFLASSQDEAIGLVEETLKAQQQRTEIQKQGETLIENRLAASGVESFVFEFSEEFHKGIVGLLATKATQNHGVPSFVGSLIADKIVGSARAPEGQSLLEAFAACSEALDHFGGHHQAAGFQLPVTQADHFKSLLSEYYADQVFERPPLQYDVVADLGEWTDQFKHWLKKLEPYGVGFKSPMIRMNHLFVSSVRILKEKHLKLQLKDMNGHQIDALWFFAPDIEDKKQLRSQRVSVVVEPSINTYMGKESLQAFIRDLRVEYS